MKIKKLCAVLLCASAMLQGAANAQAMGLASWINRYGELTDTAVDAQNKLWVRDIEEWSDFETDDNGIIIPERVKKRYKRLKEENKEIVMVLAYGNALYGDSNTAMPTVDNTEYFEKWLNYVRTVVTEFKDEVNYFEIWNEPNLAVSNPNATATDYAKMAVATKNAIKEIKEDAYVIGGAIAYANRHKQFTRDFYNNGGNEMDALSFHIYEYAAKPAYESDIPPASFRSRPYHLYCIPFPSAISALSAQSMRWAWQARRRLRHPAAGAGASPRAAAHPADVVRRAAARAVGGAELVGVHRRGAFRFLQRRRRRSRRPRPRACAMPRPTRPAYGAGRRAAAGRSRGPRSPGRAEPTPMPSWRRSRSSPSTSTASRTSPTRNG